VPEREAPNWRGPTFFLLQEPFLKLGGSERPASVADGTSPDWGWRDTKSFQLVVPQFSRLSGYIWVSQPVRHTMSKDQDDEKEKDKKPKPPKPPHPGPHDPPKPPHPRPVG
jgi:hypothetical protein